MPRGVNITRYADDCYASYCYCRKGTTTKERDYRLAYKLRRTLPSLVDDRQRVNREQEERGKRYTLNRWPRNAYHSDDKLFRYDIVARHDKATRGYAALYQNRRMLVGMVVDVVSCNVCNTSVRVQLSGARRL